MVPLHELLARIRWDPDFGRGRFVLGYLDHVVGGIVRVDLKDSGPDPDNPGLLQVWDEEGVAHSIPLHRVKQVFRDGVLIWQRQR